MKSSVRTVPWLQHTIISQQLIYGKLHCCSQHNYSLELWKKASLNLSLLMQTFFTTPPDGCCKYYFKVTCEGSFFFEKSTRFTCFYLF